jgi:hypothetical protein
MTTIDDVRKLARELDPEVRVSTDGIDIVFRSGRGASTVEERYPDPDEAIAALRRASPLRGTDR